MLLLDLYLYTLFIILYYLVFFCDGFICLFFYDGEGLMCYVRCSCM